MHTNGMDKSRFESMCVWLASRSTMPDCFHRCAYFFSRRRRHRTFLGDVERIALFAFCRKRCQTLDASHVKCICVMPKHRRWRLIIGIFALGVQFRITYILVGCNMYCWRIIESNSNVFVGSIPKRISALSPSLILWCIQLDFISILLWI